MKTLIKNQEVLIDRAVAKAMRGDFAVLNSKT